LSNKNFSHLLDVSVPANRPLREETANSFSSELTVSWVWLDPSW